MNATISRAAVVAMLEVRRQLARDRRIAACGDGEFRVWVDGGFEARGRRSAARQWSEMMNSDGLASNIEVTEAGPRTPALAHTQLLIAQTYLLEMIKGEGQGGDASRAFEHVAKAVEILAAYPIEREH